MLTVPSRVQQSATFEEKRAAAKAMAKYEQRKRDGYSLWCDSLYRLSIANHVCFFSIVWNNYF